MLSAFNHIRASPCGTSLRFARGGGAGWRGGGVFLGIRGVAGSRAWERLKRGREVGGAYGKGRVRNFSGKSTLLRLPVLPLLCLMALPCCAFRRLPSRRSREGDSGAGRRYVRIGFGCWGVAGSRARERLWRGRGVGKAHSMKWLRDFSGNSTRLRLEAFLCRALQQFPTVPFGASLLCPRAHPCRVFRRFPVHRSGEGGSGWWRGAREVRGV